MLALLRCHFLSYHLNFGILRIHIKSFLNLVWFIDNFCQNVSYQSQKPDTKGGSISMGKLQVWKIFLWGLNIRAEGWLKEKIFLLQWEIFVSSCCMAKFQRIWGAPLHLNLMENCQTFKSHVFVRLFWWMIS